MGTALTLLYLVAFPLTGTALAILSVFASSRPAAGSPALPPEVRARLRILVVHIIILVVFAFLLMVLLSGPKAGELPNPVQEAAAMAYGVPALLAGVGFALLYLTFVGRVTGAGRTQTLALQLLDGAQALLVATEAKPDADGYFEATAQATLAPGEYRVVARAGEAEGAARLVVQ